MIIDEKALIRAMKDAYKTTGYDVAKRASGERTTLLLQAPLWQVEITWQNVPPKVLAMIVEHIQTIPEIGQAFTAKKGETATTLYSMLEDMPVLSEEDRCMRVCRTPVVCFGNDVWQTDEKECRFVYPGFSELLMYHGRVCRWVHGKIYLEGKVSKALISTRIFQEGKPEHDAEKFLSGRKWW